MGWDEKRIPDPPAQLSKIPEVPTHAQAAPRREPLFRSAGPRGPRAIGVKEKSTIRSIQKEFLAFDSDLRRADYFIARVPGKMSASARDFLAGFTTFG